MMMMIIWGDLQEPSLWNSGRNFYTSQWKYINHPVGGSAQSSICSVPLAQSYWQALNPSQLTHQGRTSNPS